MKNTGNKILPYIFLKGQPTDVQKHHSPYTLQNWKHLQNIHIKETKFKEVKYLK